MPNYKITASQIDAILPQTQCRECGYQGCFPYAKAIVNQDAALNLCAPGGIKTLKEIAELLEQDATPWIPGLKNPNPTPKIAHIREPECIGCTKCISACPVDAIIGASKQMHTIITDECTGCGLCLPPCPVNCIDLNIVEENSYNPEKAKDRYYARKRRLDLAEKNALEKAKAIGIPLKSEKNIDKKAEIAAAMARVKAKKL